MTAQTKAVIKSYFLSGDKPTQQQFADLVDSYQNTGTPVSVYYVDAGSANQYAITTSPITSSYTDGLAFDVKIGNNNNGMSTLNAGAGPASITYMDGTSLAPNALVAGGVASFVYATPNFQLQNITPASTGGITALTGDVTASGPGSSAATIATNAVTNAKLNVMAANTVKANATAGSAVPTDIALTASTILGMGASGNIGPQSVDLTLTFTGTVLGVSVATQANQETSTSLTTFVTPGRQQFHPSAIKFWAKGDFAGNISSSYNMTSITDVGTGLVTLTIATDFSSASWCCLLSWERISGTLGSSANDRFGGILNGSQAAGSVELEFYNATAAQDTTAWHCAGLGDQ